MTDPRGELAALARARAEGSPRGIVSVCSAHPLVIEAALAAARSGNHPVLIEATCNQVNQDGGYSGMTPADFACFVHEHAARIGLPKNRIILGGDHLGPNPWRGLPQEAALDKAEAMVAGYAAAGFLKLHLDTSMRCADDPPALPETVVAARAARLARAAEAAAPSAGHPSPLYVVGTEVPTPGGEQHELSPVTPTDKRRARATMAAHAAAFAAQGIGEVTARIIALVVQPGVEFGNLNVALYDPPKAAGLAESLKDYPDLVFEAHSTDYQPRARLRALVRDGFAILKVGPELTFALRAALYALDDIAAVLDGETALKRTMEEVMLATPVAWQGYCAGNESIQKMLRHYGYSDRIRYYWRAEPAIAAVQALLARFSDADIPHPLIAHFFPMLHERVLSGKITPRGRDLVMAAIVDVLARYQFAASGWDETSGAGITGRK